MTDSQQRPPLSSTPNPRVPPAPPPMNMGRGQVSAGPTQQIPSKTLQQSGGGAAPAPGARPSPPPAPASQNSPPVNASAQKARMPARSVGLSPGHPTLEQLVHHAYEKGFSDVHVGVGENPRYRNRGEMEITDYPVTDQATFMSWLREVLTDEEIRRFQ